MLSKENIEEQVVDNQSRLIRIQKEDTLLSSSQQILKLPEGFTIGKVIGRGDCFFDAVAQGLKQLKPKMNFTVKSLREVCKKHASDNPEIKDKIITDAKYCVNEEGKPSPKVSDGELWDAYLVRVVYTAEDMEEMKNKRSSFYEELTDLKYGVTLNVPIWGRPEIEGNMICNEYNIKLHVVENLPYSGWSSYLIDGLASKCVDTDYNEKDTIHIINEKGIHFEPILMGTAQQILSHYYDTIASEKRLDSESVCFQQISGVEMKDVTDNQTDCEYYKESSLGVEVLPAESIIGATVDYEDRLSNEELQYKQSQESPVSSRVADSSSIDSDSVWYSTLVDRRSTVGTANSSSDKVIIEEVANCFIQIFVKEFEEKLSQYSKEAKPDSKVRKSGKLTAEADSIIKSSVGSGIHPPSIDPISIGEQIFYIGAKKPLDYCLEKHHRRKAKVIFKIIHSFKYDQRKVLVEAGLEIFQKFEEQFTRVIDVGKDMQWGSRERAIQKLAIDAVYRVMDYASNDGNMEKSFFDFITKGVVLGESKRETVAKSLHLGPAGYQVQDRQSSKIWTISKLYKSVGIVKIEDGTTKYYRLKRCDRNRKYGYRRAFLWELENWSEIEEKYEPDEIPKKEYAYILDEEKKEKLASFMLKEINEQDSVKVKDIENVKKHLRAQDEDGCQFSYNFGKIAEFFIERKEVIKELNLKLHCSSQELEMSRVVLISGKPGTGKSELARGYGFNERRKGAFVKIIWIDASSHTNLLTSFSELARKLGIPGQDRRIESIVKDIYEHYQNTKSFFVFDNVSGYKEIEKFLPSNFFGVFSDREKPFILITSYEGWGDKRIKEIKLNNFDPGESNKFLRKALERDESQDNISELGKTLNYHPLSLAGAAADINQRGTSISEYLKRYYEKTQESNLDHLVELGISEEGQRSCDILAFIDYLNRGQKTAPYALNLLDKFSVIELEKSIAKIHEGTRKTIIEEERTGTTEETLRKIMTSLMDSDTISVTHIISVWSYASKYKELVNEFIHSTYNESTILHLLAQDGNEEVIRLILEKIGQDKLSKAVNTTNKIGLAPIHFAISYDRLEIVKYLIDKGANLTMSEYGVNYAAAYGALEVMKYFINEKYFTIDELNEQGKIPLGYAIRYDQLRMVKYLIGEGADISQLDNEEKLYLFYYAFLHGNLDIIKYLVEKSANIDLKDEYGMSPLHYAAIHSNLEIIKYLVESGADVNLQNENSMSPLYYAVVNGNLDIVKCLVENGANINLGEKSGKNTLHYAVMNGNLNTVKYLVENGTNIDLQDEDGMSPLYYAVMNDNLDIVKCLVENGADVNLQDENSMSLLHYATIYGNLDIVKCLVENGANVDLDDASDMSPLHHAAIYDNLDIVKYLVENGADVNLEDESGMTPLHYAVVDGNLDIVKYLVENSANVNLQDENSMTPLHYAVMNGNLDIVKYLVENSANVNLQDENSMTPLHYAVMNGNLDIVKYLVENSANVNLQDENSMTPLYYAVEYDHLDIVQYFIERGNNGIVASYLSSAYIQSLRIVLERNH